DSGSNPSPASVNTPSSSRRLRFDFDCGRLCRCRRRPRKRRRHIRQPRARAPLQSLACVAAILIASSAAAEGTDAFSFVSPISPLVRASVNLYLYFYEKVNQHITVDAVNSLIELITTEMQQNDSSSSSSFCRVIKPKCDQYNIQDGLLGLTMGKVATIQGHEGIRVAVFLIRLILGIARPFMESFEDGYRG
ncbi:unnamed protein product, partial [Linum tenue]